jgi:hypothetical protein
MDSPSWGRVTGIFVSSTERNRVAGVDIGIAGLVVRVGVVGVGAKKPMRLSPIGMLLGLAFWQFALVQALVQAAFYSFVISSRWLLDKGPLCIRRRGQFKSSTG